MNVLIEKAGSSTLPEVEALYNDICDFLADKEYNPGWRKGCFPTVQDAQMFLEQDALWVARIDGRIAGSVALTHSPNAESNEESKYTEEEREDILYVHILVVHPDYHRNGVGTELLRFADRLAVQEKINVLHLYVYEKNTVARKSYEKNGYSYVEMVDIGLSQYGLDWFCLYEKNLC